MSLLIWLAVLPSLVIAFLIYKADSREKEPKKELLKAFLLGFVSVILTLVISFIFHISSIVYDSRNLLSVALYSFVGISFIEEFCKWVCTCFFLKNNKNFDYMFDGIVYATFVSLGFATIENILYTLYGGLLTGIIRAITTVPAHAFFGISSGYFLSLFKKNKVFKKINNYNYLFLSLFIPFLLHGFYDFCLLSKNYIFFIIFLIFVVSLYSFSIYQVKKMKNMEMSFFKRKVSYCKNCGSKVKTKFCRNCGSKVEENS